MVNLFEIIYQIVVIYKVDMCLVVYMIGIRKLVEVL